ncbi:MAG: methyltransferase domain-containing protein [Methylophilaceae bacterium]|nr:MAG: methyltransferase domain-containing protein [Methylophilaceae bacterium]
MIKCNVCNSSLINKVYDTAGATSITSVCTTVEYPTEVYYCTCCEHIQTLEMPDELSYYDETYNFLAESEEEDQVYIVEDGEIVYRTQHQVTTMLKKLVLPNGSRVLDYGCAKSSTMRELTRRGLSITPYLFDISERYTSYWQEFIEDGKWATYKIPEDWNNHFNVVTSFFSLEHISKLSETLQSIRKVLIDGGKLYAIIPNTQTNPADLIVVDHPNHFTKASLERLLFDNDFSVIEIDDTAHRGAYVVVAEKTTPQKRPQTPDKSLEEVISAMGDFWKDAALRVKNFEKNEAKGLVCAIYGAGFYGSFLASNLNEFDSVKYFLDQNPFLHGTKLMGRPIIHPKELPKEIDVIYVALNPKHSKAIISEIECLSTRNISYFYI